MHSNTQIRVRVFHANRFGTHSRQTFLNHELKVEEVMNTLEGLRLGECMFAAISSPDYHSNVQLYITLSLKFQLVSNKKEITLVFMSGVATLAETKTVLFQAVNNKVVYFNVSLWGLTWMWLPLLAKFTFWFFYVVIQSKKLLLGHGIWRRQGAQRFDTLGGRQSHRSRVDRTKMAGNVSLKWELEPHGKKHKENREHNSETRHNVVNVVYLNS